MGYFIFMWIVAAVVSAFFLFVNTMDYMNYRDHIKDGPGSRWHTEVYYHRAKKNIGKSRRYMRWSFVALLLSFTAGILVPVGAVVAAGYGVWKLIYMLFFEKVEIDD